MPQPARCRSLCLGSGSVRVNELEWVSRRSSVPSARDTTQRLPGSNFGMHCLLSINFSDFAAKLFFIFEDSRTTVNSPKHQNHCPQSWGGTPRIHQNAFKQKDLIGLWELFSFWAIWPPTTSLEPNRPRTLSKTSVWSTLMKS